MIEQKVDVKLQTLESIRELLKNVEYRDWKFHVEEEIVQRPHFSRGEDHRYFWLQIRFLEKDLTYRTEIIGVQHGRKWLISAHATDSEIIQTALMAVIAAEEHEARERFRYKGQSIFSPHYDAEDLVELAKLGPRGARR
ncbi:MAG: hypothetical protein Kow0098_03290 [Ignavibacteriaceae bacterium]